MTKYISRAAIAAAALAFGVSGANATNNIASGALSVSATVITACTVGAGNLAFGNVATNTVTPTSASANISITCPVAYTVGSDQGLHWDSTANKFQVADSSGTHFIDYTLSDNPGGGITWTGTSNPGSATPTTLTVYGILSGLSGQPAGAYTDTVQIQISY